MAAPKPYLLADRAIAKLNRLALRRLDKTKQTLLLDGFDELNVIKQLDELYRQLDGDNRKAFRELYMARYAEMTLHLKGRRAKEDEIDELAELFITGLLSEPSDITHYIYDAEITRKRDRAKEAVVSVLGRQRKQFEMDKALRYWSQMTAWYVDSVSDGANLQALKDTGIKEAEWNTQTDEKVCKLCAGKDGKIYGIDDIPAKPHPNCRCWISAI